MKTTFQTRFDNSKFIEAFGHELPQFAHLPLILGRKVDDQNNPVVSENGEAVYERLSKRNQVVDIDYYKTKGYLPEGLLNYLAQLGLTNPDAEIYQPQELIDKFELEKG